MNILFLVFGFILIFLFFSSTLLKQTIFFSSEQKSSISFIEGKIKIHDKLERYKYKKYDEKIKSVKPSTRKKEGKERKEDAYQSHRMKVSFSSEMKWNLAPLIFNEKTSSYLEEATINFLESLYGHTNFWKKGEKLIPELASSLLNSFKEKKQIDKICDLFPLDLSLQPIFYKMLKGSGYYDVASKQGYPPLEDFFRLEKENIHTLSLPYASFPALKALLGDDLAGKILELEKNKWEEKRGYYSISKEEFASLVVKSGTFIPIQDFDAFLQKDQKKIKLEKITHKEGKRAYLEIPLP